MGTTMMPLRWTRGLVMAGALIGAATGTAFAQISEDDVRSALASEFGVEVLKIARTSGPSGPAYEVTVMNPGGDYNAAFQVNTLLVDRQTGRLLSAFQHLPAGYELSGGPTYRPETGSGETMRRRSLEGPR